MALSRESDITGTAEQIAARIRGDIESGRLAPGTPLNQVALASRFGLSRIPVREALRHLTAEGYLEYRPNKGAVVAGGLPADETLEIIEIREVLETRLMAHAAAHMTQDVLSRAAESLRALNRAGVADVAGSHARFHTILFEAAARPHMAGIINGWRFRLHPHPHTDGRRKRDFARDTRDVHRRLMGACAKGDVREVRRCVAEEYEIIRRVVIDGAAAP
jgi:DNA-binding GntR family transcriptional regulator